jgi:diaminopimelate decarboxylase
VSISFQKAIETVAELIPHCPKPPQYVNLGGGFGIPYFAKDRELDIEKVGLQLKGQISRFKQQFGNMKIVVETGRYLIGDSGIYLTKILYKKVSRGEIFLIVDGGLNHHLSATGNLGQIIKKNYPIALPDRIQAEPEESVNIVGPLCTPIDKLANQVLLPQCQEGDLIAIFASGAYGFSASPLRFLSHPEPAQIVINCDR